MAAQAHALPRRARGRSKVFHTTTRVGVRPSLKYDALCALNMLSGDPYYLKFYRDDYNRLAPRLTPPEKNEFVAIKKIIKDQEQGHRLRRSRPDPLRRARRHARRLIGRAR